ncbi:MAG: putative D-alanyl-D-alanine carboxypeptidase, partial [Actinomycetota bacterium]
MADRRRPNPLVVLTIAAVLPAASLWAFTSWARDRAADASQAAPADWSEAGNVAPAPAMPTALLSFRRTADELSDRLNLDAFRSAVQPLLGAVDDRSCVSVSVGGTLIGERNADIA